MGFVCLFLFLFCLFFKLFFNPRVISHYCNNTILQAGIWPIVEQHTKLIQITLCSCFIIYRACLTFPTGPRQYSLQLGDQFKGSSRGRASCVVEAFIQDLRGKFLFFPLQTHDSSNWSNFKNFDCKKKRGNVSAICNVICWNWDIFTEFAVWINRCGVLFPSFVAATKPTLYFV